MAGIALTFGLVVMALIYALGDSSGCHINPAATIAFALARRFPWRAVPAYVIAQLFGAFLAGLVLDAMFPGHRTLGATLPVGPPVRSFILEIVLSLILFVVVLSVATGPKERGIMAGIAIGGVVALEAMFAGPISGASMNPARSIAPAVLSGQTQHLWVYIAGPLLGAAAAVPLTRAIHHDRPNVPG